MNHWHTEYRAEYHRHELMKEMKQVRLEELARQSMLYRPGHFQRLMQKLGAWLVAVGEELLCRYQAPAADCAQPSQRSYAG